jgi:hypothetical protein
MRFCPRSYAAGRLILPQCPWKIHCAVFDAENFQSPSDEAVEYQIVFKIGLSLLAPEARQTVAHGETVGLAVEQNKPRQGRQKTV